MLSGLQIRAARALLRWSAQKLAEAAKVGVATVRRFELEDGIPSGNARILDAIKRAVEGQGIEFIGTPDDGPPRPSRPTARNTRLSGIARLMGTVRDGSDAHSRMNRLDVGRHR